MSQKVARLSVELTLPVFLQNHDLIGNLPTFLPLELLVARLLLGSVCFTLFIKFKAGMQGLQPGGWAWTLVGIQVLTP